MKHTKPFFKASVQGDTLEMLVYEDLGKSYDGSGVTASDVKAQIDAAKGYNSIAVRINSPGGDVFEGLAICNLLKQQAKPVAVYIDGLAASAASIVAMAGDSITMGNNALMMIHNAWCMSVGDAVEMRKMADVLDKVSTSVAQTYVDRTGLTMDEVKAMMDAETWLSAEECVVKGLATAIASDDTDEAMNLARSFKALAKMKNVPTSLKASAACECDCAECKDGDCEHCSMTGCVDPNCTDCPMQQMEAKAEDKTITVDVTPEASNLSQYEARLSLLKHK